MENTHLVLKHLFYFSWNSVSQTIVPGPSGIFEYTGGDPRTHVQKVKQN